MQWLEKLTDFAFSIYNRLDPRVADTHSEPAPVEYYMFDFHTEWKGIETNRIGRGLKKSILLGSPRQHCHKNRSSIESYLGTAWQASPFVGSSIVKLDAIES